MTTKQKQIEQPNKLAPIAQMLERLTEKVERANAIQHSRRTHTIPAEDWSELYMLCGEARTELANFKKPQA